MKKNLFLILVFAAAFSACATTGPTLTAEQKEAKIEKLIANKDFVGLFRNAKQIGTERNEDFYDISSAVKKYFKKYGDSREDVIKTLDDAWFEIHTTSTQNWYEKRSHISFDERIYGHRKNTPFYIFRYKKYTISIYMKAGRVNNVVAMTSYELLYI